LFFCFCAVATKQLTVNARIVNRVIFFMTYFLLCKFTAIVVLVKIV
jgi:hypothetical protein